MEAGEAHSSFTVVLHVFLFRNTISLSKVRYNGNSPNGYSRKQTALLAVAFTKPVFLNSYTDSVFLHSHKQLAPVTDTFCAS